MEIVYTNDLSKITTSSIGFYGDILDLINQGIEIEGIDYDDEWTVKRFLSNSRLFANKRIDTVLKYLELDSKYLKVKIKDLSKVTFKYVLLAHALLNNKRNIIFERFEIGLSNKEKKNILQILIKLQNDGINLVFISKDLIFLNQIVDNIVVIKNKKIVYNDSIIKLINSKKPDVELPPVCKFVEYANKKKAGLDMTLDHKELLKDIYRSVC